LPNSAGVTRFIDYPLQAAESHCRAVHKDIYQIELLNKLFGCYFFSALQRYELSDRLLVLV